jgi:phosphotransferase system enzyme I (PtsP)
MLEVPALAFQMPSLLRRANFISVGSNDLFQFLFASDRGNPRLADRYDPLSPGALSFLRHLVIQCDGARVPISLCGEMAGRPLDAMALVGIGFRRLSMAPSAIGPVKTMIRSLSLESLTEYMESLFDQPEHSVREKLRAFAVDHGVKI